LLAAFLVVLAGTGPAALQAQPSPAVNPNPYVSPYQALGRNGGNTAVLGSPPQNVGAGFAGFPAGGSGPSYGAPGSYGSGGYSALLANTGSGGYGGSGSLNNNYGYGMMGSWATQWMMNPYEGYLSGAAAVTNANAQYQLTIQQAKLLRQEAVRSAMDTRRRIIEEAEYERNHLPDPEKIRQADLARELDRARADPPLTEVWSGKALNALLRHLVKQQARGEKGPNISLTDGTHNLMENINLTPADSRGNAGLLRNIKARGLEWPQPLMDARFKQAREDLDKRLRDAAAQARDSNAVDPANLKDLGADLQTLNDTLEANVSALSPSQYIEARRYLNMVADAVRALESRNVANFFNKWVAQSKNVAELVKFMSDQGLQFAPATPGDEPAYRALYHAMAAFDAGMPRLAQGNNSGDR
jgi:hypothetical protein